MIEPSFRPSGSRAPLGWRAAPVLAGAVLLLVPLGAPVADEENAAEAGVVEDVEVRRVQIDLSITRKDSLRSVPGITLDQLDIRLDGRPIDETVRRRAALDYICDDAGPAETGAALAAAGLSPELAFRPTLVLVDFNYLDAFGREQVGKALEELAATAGDGPYRYKVYGFARQLRLLTPGFTSSGADLREAARRVRQVAWSRKRADGGREFSAGALDPESDIPTAGSNPFESSLVPPLTELAGLSDEEAFALELGFADGRWADAASDYRPTSSLGAIESVLRAHAELPGRKVLVLFSSEAFTFADTSRRELETRGVRETARRGFTIWTVDVEGVSRRGSGILLSSLAMDTGGRAVRRTGRLAMAFEGAREQLSCYYLLSLPVVTTGNGSTRRDLLVRVDADRFPELWGLRVGAPSEVVLLDEGARRRERQLAVILSPDDFTDIPVTAALGYPIPAPDGDGQVLPVRVRIPLAAVAWRPDDAGGFRAKVLVDALVERDTGGGTRVLRALGRDEQGVVLDVRMPRPPHPHEEVGLQLELSSVHAGDGLLTARAAITDLETGAVGGGRSTVFVERRGSAVWAVHAPRVETLAYAPARRDLLWTVTGSQIQRSVTRDTAGTAWRPVTAAVPGSAGDHLALYHVVCGPDLAALDESLRYLVLRRDVAGSRGIELWLGSGDVVVAEADAEGPFCSAASARVDAAALFEPGEYAFAVVSREAARGRDLAARLLDRLSRPGPPGLDPEAAPEDGIHAVVPFTLR